MRGRVLRTEIEEHEVGLRAATFEAPVLRIELQSRLLGLLFLVWESERLHVCCPCRMLFAQGMAGPRGWHEETTQMGMPRKGDAEHVPGFALVPVGCWPQVDHARQRGVLPIERDFEANIGIAGI